MSYVSIDNNFDYVSIKNTNFDDIINVRTWDFNDRINFLKSAINDKGLRNANVLINISLLLRRLNNFDEDIFDRDDIYFTTIVELVDAKLELQEELNVLRKEIVKYYFSVIKSLAVKNEEQSKYIDNLYFMLLRILSVYDISVMLQKIGTNDIDIEYVKDANIIYNDMLNNE